MQHEPCSLLSYAQVPGNLVTGNPILAVRNQPERRKPLVQANRRILKNGANFERKFLFLMIAIAPVYIRLRKPGQFGCAAIRTFHFSIWPTHKNHELAAVLRIAKVLNRLLQGPNLFHSIIRIEQKA